MPNPNARRHDGSFVWMCGANIRAVGRFVGVRRVGFCGSNKTPGGFHTFSGREKGAQPFSLFEPILRSTNTTISHKPHLLNYRLVISSNTALYKVSGILAKLV